MQSRGQVRQILVTKWFGLLGETRIASAGCVRGFSVHGERSVHHGRMTRTLTNLVSAEGVQAVWLAEE